MKKKTQNEIVGREVMVHPYLTTDPIQRQGQIGKVVEISADTQVLTVQFNDGKKAAYLSDGLLTLCPKKIISQGLLSSRNDLRPDNRKIISSVLGHLQKKNNEEIWKLAMSNDTTKFFCITTCDNWLDMKKEQKKNRSKGLKK